MPSNNKLNSSTGLCFPHQRAIHGEQAVPERKQDASAQAPAIPGLPGPVAAERPVETIETKAVGQPIDSSQQQPLTPVSPATWRNEEEYMGRLLRRRRSRYLACWVSLSPATVSSALPLSLLDVSRLN